MVSWESLPLVPEEAPFLCIVMEHLGVSKEMLSGTTLTKKGTECCYPVFFLEGVVGKGESTGI